MGGNVAERKCPRCGKLLEEDIEIGGLCSDCYFEQNNMKDTIRPLVSFVVCPQCGRVRLGHSWRYYSEEELASVLKKRLQKIVERIPVTSKVFSRTVNIMPINEEGKIVVGFRFSTNKKTVEKKWEFSEFIKREVCPECIKRKIGYHKAVVQIRTEGIGRQELIKAIEKIGNPRIYGSIVEIEEGQEGVDIKFSEQSTARMLVNRLLTTYPGDVRESFKLVSERGGEKISRLTISLRLYSGKTWELGEVEDKVILFRKASGGRILVKELGSFEKTVIRESSFSKLIRPYRGFYRIVQVVAVSEDKYSAIDLENYTNYYEIPKSRAFGSIEKGDEAVLITLNEGEYIIARRLLRDF